MIHTNVELVILVKGRPITEYNHRGQVFIEGRDGNAGVAGTGDRRQAGFL